MLVEPITVSFVIDPLAFINVAISMPKLPLAISFIVVPFTLVFAAIRPQLHSPARFESCFVNVAFVFGL